MIADFLVSLEGFIWSIPFIAFVIICGIYFTVRTKFFTVVHFGHIMKHTFMAMISPEAKEKKKGGISPFEAACIAIGGCVGAGNLGGVATSITVGGPGAVFWLWLWAFLGMMVKCVEVTLGCYYRNKDENGNFSGGTMYFMEKGIGIEKGMKGGFVLAMVFALGFLFQFLQGSQAYTISEVMKESFGFEMIPVTIVYVIITMYIIWKGLPGIAKFATRCVPFMCVAFVLGGVGLLIANISVVPSMFVTIFHDAFTGTAAVGGFAGATVSTVISSGLSRSINSNEAGQGSSPLVHGSANTIHPVRQGLWGAFEVFIDTIIVCSVTALSILCTGVWDSGIPGAALTITAYDTLYGTAGKIFIGIMTILFGLTTTAGWFAYYAEVIKYIFKNNLKLANTLVNCFKIVFPMMNIIVVGYIVISGNDAKLFWTIVSIVLALPVFTNLIGLIILRKKFMELFNDYKARYMGIGEVKENFKIFYED